MHCYNIESMTRLLSLNIGHSYCERGLFSWRLPTVAFLTISDCQICGLFWACNSCYGSELNGSRFLDSLGRISGFLQVGSHKMHKL